MGKIVMDMSMSLDGFIAAKNDNPNQPLGEDGQRLHEWYFKDNAEAYNKEIEEDLASLGAVIIGRRTYENSHAWGGKGPLGSVPCLVLAHADHVPPKEEIGPVFTFVSDGIASALAKAKALAGDKDIAIMGANVQQQFLVAGLLDEIHVDVVPVLLCEGVRLFDRLGSKHISLEQTEVGEGDQVAHLTYRVVK
ncbi:MAG TPA: dihydrofolate reductase family protein [Ktedonobacteraceae bacterium]|nr:dihydrofolate reductase family protein [Ktedonobacteraceae bacterium]